MDRFLEKILNKLNYAEDREANGRERNKFDIEGNAQAFQSPKWSNHRLKAGKCNGKLFFFGSHFLFGSSQKGKKNKEEIKRGGYATAFTLAEVFLPHYHSPRRVAFTLAEVFSPHYHSPRRVAFTLAEVLITLGIIGVVAAMTLPTLTAKYKKSVVETSLKKFYTTANQAVKLSIVKNGETEYWEFPAEYNSEELLNFYNKYFKDELKTLKITNAPDNAGILLYFADGSGAQVVNKGHDWLYCLDAKNIDDVGNGKNSTQNDLLGRECFHFGFYPSKNGSCTTGSYGYQNFYNKGIEPHVYCDLRNPDGSINTDTPGLVTKNDLYTHPSMYTKAIQINGWTIPDDYPIRF